MKICLPIAYPPITSFPCIANQMSFLWNHKERVLPWYADRYIQLLIRPQHPLTRSDFYENADIDNFIVPGNFCPFYRFMRNNQTTAHFEKFTDYIEYNIKKEYYIEPCLDNYFLSCSIDSFQKQHHVQTAFIYGFDNVTKEIYLSNYSENGSYVNTKVKYEEINKSIEGIDYFIGLYKYQDFDYHFNIDLLKASIQDYLNCRDSFNRFTFSSPPYNRNILYGLDVYDYIRDVFCEEENIDIRPFHTLYDHKIMHHIRLEYLNSIHLLNDNEFATLSEFNNEIMKDTFHLRNIVLDYYVNHHRSSIMKIKERCNAIKHADYIQFSELLKCLN